jgi:hypothetical protein
MKNKILGVLGILFMPLVSAYSSSFFSYYRNPVDMFINSEWIRFLLVFGVFYALVFYSIKGRFEGGKSKGPAVIISFCVALLITIALAQQGLFFGYFGGDFSSWLIFLAILMGMIFIISASYKNFGAKFTGVVLLILWFIFAFYFNPVSWISSGSASDFANLIYYAWISFPGLVVTFLIAIGMFFIKKKDKGFNISAAK